ncbi:MAG TPA: hypothetical protein VJU01_03435 [Gaiellaceae bacterium]|nr:hypothetical protein [Gaiellaceae bacterium]
MGRTTYSKLRIVLATLAVALITVAPATSAPDVPQLVGPNDGDTVSFLPVFSWDPVTGADKYNFLLAADSSFNSVVYQINGTKNTRATPDKTVPNGTYYWRVQAVDADGNTSGWSDSRQIDKLWADSPVLAEPDEAATISFPDDPLVLRWQPVPGAAKYHIYISPNEDLSSLVSGEDPLETQATNAAPAILLSSNTYYWAVIPIDAQGNEGEPSETRSFVWDWPSTTATDVVDVEPSTEFYVPEFTWDPIPGAAKYEVEINSVFDFPAGASKVCCDSNDWPITTTFTPKETLPNNTYYWRVRAINAHGEAGDWNEGPSFVKTFANYPLLDELGVKNLHMRDASDPGTDIDLGTPGYQTQLPIIAWDPVPGASSYQVNVGRYDSSIDHCDFGDPSSTRWLSSTASTYWTPLAQAPGSRPYPTGPSPTSDQPPLLAGEDYCVQVRARSGRLSLSSPVWGDFTQLNDGTGAAFTFTGYPVGSPCSPSCNANYLGHNDYLEPQRLADDPTAQTAQPLFVWKPIAGAQSYWVIVAKDPNFTNIIDYTLTRVTAYAVRTGSQPRTYPDETTAFYWVVLPSTSANGYPAGTNPALGAYADFLKQTVAPTLLAPDNGHSFALPPTFSWTAVPGAKKYHFQVATEPTFSSATKLDDLTTALTEYTAQKTYVASKTLYWRVQAQDEKDNGLTWSEIRTFEVDLPRPTLDPATPTLGDASLPVLRWFPVPGAVSYTLRIHEPNDTTPNSYSGFPSTAASFSKITGTGLFTWEVRADFPKLTGGTTPGPWSDDADYTHTIKEPTNPVSSAGANRLVLSWDAKTGTKAYKVQISKREDFNPAFETKTTDNPDWAPTLSNSNYTSGGDFWWRVAAIDGDGNVGAYATNPEHFQLPALSGGAGGGGAKTFKVTFSGRLVKNRARDITVKVRDSVTLNVIQGALVRAYGAGVSYSQKTTNSSGVAKFRLKPTQLQKVSFRITKSGYVSLTVYRRVYRP